MEFFTVKRIDNSRLRRQAAPNRFRECARVLALGGVVAARAPRHLPVVLTIEEVEAVLGRMRGTTGLIARLLYGSGLRIMECLRLRVKDIDFTRREILVRDGKGAKDRVTMLADTLVEALQRHLDRVRDLHAEDLAGGFGSGGGPGLGGVPAQP